MTDMPLVAGVAVENTDFGFDKLYDYIVPEKMCRAAVGCRVKVSFGHSLRQGMILSLRESEDTEKLKSISEIIDKEPVLSEELAGLAVYMKEHCFCTYFDACCAMLPTGLSVKLTYEYYLSGNEEPVLLSSDENAVVSYLSERKKPVRQDRLIKALALEDEGILNDLVRKKAISRSETVKKRIADASVRMIRLAGEVPEGKYTAAQSEVIRILKETGQASVKEICYFAGVTQAVTDNLVKKGICVCFDAEPPKNEEVYEDTADAAEDIILTPQQQKAYDDLLEKYEQGEPSVTLLYGITGSGKTSVFMKLIDRVNKDGKGIICMVPEIALTPQLLAKFKKRYGQRVAVFHSGLPLGKRLSEWKRVKDGQANIAVGTRSAVFAPLSSPGLIVMDEEQEYSYKSSASPRFHARDIAKYRCSRNKIPLLLSSATPSVESFQYAKSGRYGLCVLNKRYGSARLPDVITADMNNEIQQGNKSSYSSVLLNAIEDNLERKRQSIILINRRGHNTFVTCGKCRETISCPNCSISLTYHSANRRLMCHYCGYSVPVPEKCPTCGFEKLRYGGIGTQRAEQELEDIFPQARILRLDTDSTMQRYSYEKKLTAFRNGEYDIMLGTQMVAKGLDFPDVTLVGVLSADTMLHSDDFRSYERTFSLLTQVVGRSGRGDIEGRAIIQTYEPGNTIISLAAAQDYEAFFNSEIRLRRSMLYPPFSDICVAAFLSEDKKKADEASAFFAGRLKVLAESEYSSLPMRVIGPAPASVPKIGGRYRCRIIIKFKNSRGFRSMLSQLLAEVSNDRRFSDVTVYADIDPENII